MAKQGRRAGERYIRRLTDDRQKKERQINQKTKRRSERAEIKKREPLQTSLSCSDRTENYLRHVHLDCPKIQLKHACSIYCSKRI